MIAILSNDPLLHRMLELELIRAELPKSEPHAASVWLLDLAHPPRPMPKRHEGITVIGFTNDSARQGADIYLSRPFDSCELQRLLKQIAGREEQAEVQMRHLPRLLIIDQHKSPLSPAEDTILKMLMEHRGEIVGEEALASALGGDSTANVVQVHVYRLRKKLPTRGQLLIRTVRGKGYCLQGEGNA